METIIIIALVVLWLTITICAGHLMESMTNAMKKRRRTNCSDSVSERNIKILPAAVRSNCEKMAS